MKFKVGDRVIYTCTESVDLSCNGRRAVILKRTYADNGVVVHFDGDKEESSWYYDRRFTLENLYDSPLYKALE